MLRFFAQRLATALPTFLIIVTLAFFLMRLAPGGPFDAERALDPETAKNLRRIYRLDLPLIDQFWLYLQSPADFGLAWRKGDARGDPDRDSARACWSNGQGPGGSLFCRGFCHFRIGSARVCHGPLTAALFRPHASQPAGWRLERWRLAIPDFARDRSCLAADCNYRTIDAGLVQGGACCAACANSQSVWHAPLAYHHARASCRLAAGHLLPRLSRGQCAHRLSRGRDDLWYSRHGPLFCRSRTRAGLPHGDGDGRHRRRRGAFFQLAG